MHVHGDDVQQLIPIDLLARVLLRLSGTEPVIRVMVEGQDAGQVQAEAEKLADRVRSLFAA